jgi:hypothetical protein
LTSKKKRSLFFIYDFIEDRGRQHEGDTLYDKKKRNLSIRTTEDVCFVSSHNECSYAQKQRALVSDKKSSMDRSGQLGYYLAGILEGDGTIIVPKSDNTNKNVPSIYISFHINDLEFAKFLISVLGYGTIQKEHTSKAFRLVIRNRKGILDIINLVSGKFRTPKISALHLLID